MPHDLQVAYNSHATSHGVSAQHGGNFTRGQQAVGPSTDFVTALHKATMA